MTGTKNTGSGNAVARRKERLMAAIGAKWPSLPCTEKDKGYWEYIIQAAEAEVSQVDEHLSAQEVEKLVTDFVFQQFTKFNFGLFDLPQCLNFHR